MDNRSPESRSALMSRIGSRDTAPEMKIRRLLHALGYRFRVHRRDLPGTPDIAFPSRRIAIFVHGCFWHAHGCKSGRPPKSNPDYWMPKLARNRSRDREKKVALEAEGWRVLEIWQCETKNVGSLADRLIGFIGAVGKIRSTTPITLAKPSRSKG